MLTATSLQVEDELNSYVVQARNRYGRAGVLALIGICERELETPDPWVPSLVGP
jgi:hypothetical protein